MKYALFLLFSLLLLITSCDNIQETQKAEFDNLFAEVMKIHDDVMPETNNLYKLKKYAQDNINVIPDTSVYLKPLRDAQLKAEKADEVMMEWMEKFSVPTDTHENKITYLKEQLIEIEEVRKVMLSTIHDGKTIVKKSDKYIKKNKLRDEKPTIFTPR